MFSDPSRERRRLAAGCLSLAKQTTNEKVRAVLIEMAQGWLRLAERAEREQRGHQLTALAVQAAIGEELRLRLELATELQYHLFVLLMQLNNGTPDSPMRQA
jgi:hypothetical protein